MTKAKINILTATIFFALFLAFTYISLRIFFYILAPNPWDQKALAFILLTAEVFGLVHSLGYFLNVIKVIRNTTNSAPPPTLKSFPPIAIFIPSYKEPLSILHDTLICCYNLTYPNKQIYLLDDSRYDKPWDTPENILLYRHSLEKLCEKLGVNLFRRQWKGAKAGIINDFNAFVEGRTFHDLEYFPFGQKGDIEKPKYFAVFDSDMNPFPDFVEPLVAYMEEDDNVAFVQTPQFYSNFELNKVARSAGFQQGLFFEYICEGKGLDNMIFCCGTNVMIRRTAFMSVGGFDEASVTEDIATSFKLHLNGWKSLYYNKVSAFGMGPEDLSAYFKQQFRWALGTLTLSKTLVRSFFTNRRKKAPINFWWEYFLSYTHYYVGFAYFWLIAFPIIYLFFSIPVFFMNQKMYFAIFFPYLILSLNMVFYSLYMRKMLPAQLMAGLLLTTVSFPIYMKAAFYAILGIKGSFVVTPKDIGSCAVPLRSLWPQLLAIVACVAAITWGLERMYFERDPIFGFMTNIFWCIYNLAILSSIFYFNDPDINKG